MKNCYDVKDAGLLALAQGLPHLRTLHMLQVKFDTALSPGGILRFAELRGQGLSELSLPLPSTFTHQHFQDLLAFCPNLLVTSFYFMKQQTDLAMTTALDFVLPETMMKHITLKNMPSAWVGPFTRTIAANVQTLLLTECVGLSLDQIRDTVKECSSLEELRLHLCCCAQGLAMTSTKGQVAVGSVVSHTVKHLTLQFCQKVDFTAKNMARKVLELCPGVRRMQFWEGLKVYPVALLQNRLPCMEELEIYKCSLLSTSVRSAASPTTTSGAFPNLNSITFKECKNVSDRLLTVMAELSPRLSHLFVSCAWRVAVMLGPHAPEEDPTTGECLPTFGGLRRLLGRVEAKKCLLK
jgi:hypothetical protein